MISLIVVAREKSTAKKQIERLTKLKSKHQNIIEIILVTGNNPSRQRNEAIKSASGEWLYFLDDDSIVDDQCIDNLLGVIKRNPEAKIIGGPSLLAQGANDWEKAIQIVFSTTVGIGPLISRYNSVGSERKASEKEFILCNLVIHKNIFEIFGYFNEAFYPNEENEFIKRVSKVTMKIYAPDVIVRRPHRQDFDSFIRQMISYGNGRTRNFLFNKTKEDLIYYSPLCFIILVFTSLFLGGFAFAKFLIGAYLVIILTVTIAKTLKNNEVNPFLVIGVYLCSHFFYSIGLAKGFFENNKKSESEFPVKLFKV